MPAYSNGAIVLTATEQKRKWRLRHILNAAIFFTSVSILLFIVAWRIFGFDSLNMDGAYKALQHRFPYLYGAVLLLYFLFSAAKHWTAYKNDRRESDLAWAILLWILAAIAVVYLVILVLNP